MKVSSKHTENSSLSIDVELPSLQTGGTVPLLDVRAQKTVLPFKQDNTKVRSTLKSKVGPTDYSRDQGSITTYDKSPRERLLSTMYKVAHTGNGALTGLVASPVISGAKLLRPDKYFKGVNSDSKLGSAVGEMAMDLVNISPLRSPLKVAASEGKMLGAAVKESFRDSFRVGTDAYKATKGVPFLKRMDNAILSGAVSKGRLGDQVEHHYYNMSPDDVSRAMTGDMVNAPKGAVIGDFNMSTNSSPLFWNQAARGGKDYKIIRPGYSQEVNDSGYMGKRVANAFPEEVQGRLREHMKSFELNKAKMLEQVESGKISRALYEERINKMHPTKSMLEEMTSNPENFKHMKGWFENYKPVMDKGVELVNKRTGLNFPMTEIRNIESGNPYRLKYVQPTVLAVKGGHTRTLQTLKSNLQDIPRHYLINKLEEKAGVLGEFNTLRGKLRDTHMESNVWTGNINYLRNRVKNTNYPKTISVDDMSDLNIDRVVTDPTLPPPPVRGEVVH